MTWSDDEPQERRLADDDSGLAALLSAGDTHHVARRRAATGDVGTSGQLRRPRTRWVSLQAGVPADLVVDDGTELVCCCDRECMGVPERPPGVRPGAGERDDVALLRGVARGDEEALAALYDRHAGWLTVRMTRRCATPDVVDQAIQDTFLALWREAGAYRGGGDVAAFIWGIGVRRLIDASDRSVDRMAIPRAVDTAHPEYDTAVPRDRLSGRPRVSLRLTSHRQARHVSLNDAQPGCLAASLATRLATRSLNRRDLPPEGAARGWCAARSTVVRARACRTGRGSR